jgi:hypothetical protein
MKREEQKERLYFLQVSEKFFSELPVRRLLRASGGDTMLRIYLQAHCVALRTGGVLELHEDMEPAEEIGILIGAPAIETPLIAAAMQHCLAYGLISTGEGDTGKIINFSLTEAYTRAWTRDAIERREKREAEKLEAKAPQIEEKAEAEADSPKEKEDPIDYTAIKDAWNKMAKPAGLDEVLRITDKRREHIRARVREYSFDQCLRAIELVGESPFLCGKVPPKDGQKPFKADLIWVFKNSDNFTKLLEGKYKDRTQDVQPAQAQPKTQPVTEETVRDTIMREGIWNIRTQAWDRAKLDKIRDKIGPEMAAAIEAKMA